MTAGEHFERVAVVYESLRTTDEAPVRAIGQLLPGRPVTGLDIGCGTGRYTRLLRGLLPDGSLLAAADVSAAMLAQLRAASRGHAVGVVPLLAAAEQLPLRTASLDLVTAFNCVHHFDLGRFLAAAARVLQPGGQLFIYTRTPQQNARTIWGRYFPGFTEHEQRLHSQAAIRDAVRRTDGLTMIATQTFQHPRTSTAERLGAQAQGRHYSTFSFYTPQELRAAIATFLARLPGPEVCWVDEHLLVIAGASRHDQAEPDGPASLANQAIKDQALQISAGRASEAPNRRPGGRAQITPIWSAARDRRPYVVTSAERRFADALVASRPPSQDGIRAGGACAIRGCAHRRRWPVRCAHPARSRARGRAPGAPRPTVWRRWACWWTDKLIWRRRDTLAGSGGAPSGRGRQMNVFTVDLANQPGELARLCEAMAGRGINLVLSAIAREDGGTVAFIADDEAGAQEVLDGAGLQYAMRPALTIRMENQPGTGAATFRKLANAGVNADLLLPVRVSDALFFAVICVDDQDKARQAPGAQVIPPGPRPVALAAVPGPGPGQVRGGHHRCHGHSGTARIPDSRRDRLSSRPPGSRQSLTTDRRTAAIANHKAQDRSDLPHAESPNIHARHDGRPAVMTAFISSSSGPHTRRARPCVVTRRIGQVHPGGRVPPLAA